jgi:lipoyl-dependent peroxiredoxin
MCVLHALFYIEAWLHLSALYRSLRNALEKKHSTATLDTISKRISMALDKIIYTAHATATGGRDGTASIDDGSFAVKLGTPIEMGGKGGGTNPEQMFAVGYSSCFIGALKFVAAEKKIVLPQNLSIKSAVSFGTRADGARGFNIAVAMVVSIPEMAHAEALALVNEAHQVCPYSNATRGNVDVELSVI